MTSASCHRWAVAVLLVSVAAGCSTAGDPAHAAPNSSKKPPVTSSIDAGAHDASSATPWGDVGVAVDAGTAGDAVAVSAGTSYATVLRSADWAHWPGLPANLREADLVRELGLGRAKATRRDGRLSRHDVVIVETPELRYWLRDRNRVVPVEITGHLGTTPPDALRAQLGVADREGAGRFLQSGATTTEYVYAGRGLALTVAESYDHPPSFPPRLAAIQLFVATDLRTFDLELGGKGRAGPSR